MAEENDANVNRVCRFLHSRRKYNRENNKTKSLSIQIDKEDDYVISTRTLLQINTTTGNMNFSHCIKYRSTEIYPRKIHSKYNCKNEDARDFHVRSLDSGKQSYQQNREHHVEKMKDYFRENRENIYKRRKENNWYRK